MDGLREALNAAVEEHSTPVETTSTAPAATPTAAPAPAPIEGEVVSKTVEPASKSSTDTPSATPASTVETDKPKSITEVVEETHDDTKPVERTSTDPRIDRAPASWKGDAKKLWAELPLAARQEVIRRERDTAKVLQETAQDRQRVSAVQEVLAPHMDRINTIHGGNPMQAIGNLLNVERTMVNGTPMAKAQLVANMIKNFGVDIETLDGILSGQGAPAAVQQQSNIEQLLDQRLKPVMTFLEQQQYQEMTRQQAIEQQATQTVEAMASDPNFPYLNDVREEMADLIEMAARRGIAMSLEDAYEKAVRMNDGTFQAVNVRESSQSATQAALQAHQAAQKAKGAAVSVSGNPTSAGANVGNPADLRGTIEAALGNMGGRL